MSLDFFKPGEDFIMEITYYKGDLVQIPIKVEVNIRDVEGRRLVVVLMHDIVAMKLVNAISQAVNQEDRQLTM